MPNWCSTDITINCDNNEKLADFYAKIEEWTSHDYKENGFGHNWLGNIVGNSRIGTVDENKETYLRCRGVLSYMDLMYESLVIHTETAWVPMLLMWRKLLDKYLPDAELIYSAEELGCEVLATNDPYYIEKYYIDAWGIENVESNDCATKEEVIKLLQELLDIKEESIDELLKQLSLSEFNDRLYINKWEFSEVDNWD